MASLQRDGIGEPAPPLHEIHISPVRVGRGVVFSEVAGKCSPSSSSSSLGKASEDDSTVRFGSDGLDESDEAQSPYMEPLGAMHSLEESLPIRRSISRFYNGRSKSFKNLLGSITPSNSCKDLAKADNPYTRKRKNLLAFSLMYQPPIINNGKELQTTITSSDSEGNISGLEEEHEVLETPSKRAKIPNSIFSLNRSSTDLNDVSGSTSPTN